MLVYLLILAAEGLFSQTKPANKDCRNIILNYPQTSNFDNYSFRHFQVFTHESDLISGSQIFYDSFDTFFVKASYNLSSGRGIFTGYNKETFVSGGEFFLSDIKERLKGDSVICYRDIVRDGVWFNRYDTADVSKYVFDKGELMSWAYYKGDSLLEGGSYKGGKRIGEWLTLGDYLEKAYYNDNGDLIFSRSISRWNGKIQREYYPEFPEKTTRLDGNSEWVTFSYIIDYNEQGTVIRRGHYVFANYPIWSDNWYNVPYGLHKIYENGKMTRKRYPKMPKEIKYSVEKFDENGNSYNIHYRQKIN